MVQVYQGDSNLLFEVLRVSKKGILFGMVMFAFPSLLGIYAMAYLYISNVSGWTFESYIITALIGFTSFRGASSLKEISEDFFFLHKSNLSLMYFIFS